MFSMQIEDLERRRDQLQGQIAAIREMRQGSLVQRYRRCGKLACHCAKPGETGHGPIWSLTRAVGGKTVTHVIPAHAVDRTRKQIAEYKKFRELTRELIEINERLCDARLRAEQDGAGEPAKKRASKKSSRSKSRPRSTR